MPDEQSDQLPVDDGRAVHAPRVLPSPQSEHDAGFAPLNEASGRIQQQTVSSSSLNAQSQPSDHSPEAVVQPDVLKAAQSADSSELLIRSRDLASIRVLPMQGAAMPSVRAASSRDPHPRDSRTPEGGSVAHSPAASDHEALNILLQASAAAESLQQRFGELHQQRAEIAAEHQQLNADRQAFEHRAREFATQVAADRMAQRELQAELDRRLAAVCCQEETLERQTSELRAAQRALNEERVVLKQALKAELDDERGRIEQQTRLLEVERQQVQQRNEQDRMEHAERMRQLDAELEAERNRLVDRVRGDMSAELAQLQREKLEWRDRREQQRQEIQQQSEELQQQREVFGEQLQSEQSRLRDEVEKRRQMLLTEQSNLQRRYRFQFEHLGRAREDLEFEVRELRREQQLFRTERHRFTEQHRLRFRQLEKVRGLLADAEASLGRETRLIERSRTAAMSDITRQHRRAEEERNAMAQDIDSRQRRVRQQEAALAELATRLDERSQRLGSLRAELDKTQAEILEQRLATEEARVALFRDSAQSDSARARLEQARGDVQSFFDRLKAQISLERDKVEAASADVAERQQQFRRDRAELEQWFLDREAAMNARTTDSVVLDLQQVIEQQRLQLEELQERWKADRREAERTIRELLDQLTVAEMRAFHTPLQRGTSGSAADTAESDADSGIDSQRDAA